MNMSNSQSLEESLSPLHLLYSPVRYGPYQSVLGITPREPQTGAQQRHAFPPPGLLYSNSRRQNMVLSLEENF